MQGKQHRARARQLPNCSSRHIYMYEKMVAIQQQNITVLEEDSEGYARGIQRKLNGKE